MALKTLNCNNYKIPFGETEMINGMNKSIRNMLVNSSKFLKYLTYDRKISKNDHCFKLIQSKSKSLFSLTQENKSHSVAILRRISFCAMILLLYFGILKIPQFYISCYISNLIYLRRRRKNVRSILALSKLGLEKFCKK